LVRLIAGTKLVAWIFTLRHLLPHRSITSPFILHRAGRPRLAARPLFHQDDLVTLMAGKETVFWIFTMFTPSL